MRRRAALLSLCLAICLAAPARAFDYYVLSLSWSPNWCATTGDARGADQCHPRHDHGWILHGLWPQFEKGYPAHCRSAATPPTRRATATMADIMGSSGLAWHQWKKHGTCTGLTADRYFALSRAAYATVTRPDVLQRLTRPIRVAPQVIEAAFLEANPHLRADQITITCKDGHIQEARICLTRDLTPRRCGADVRRDCTVPGLFTPVR